MRIVCAGHINWDVTLVVDRLPEPDGEADVHHRVASGGGSAANTACGLVGLDAEASLLGSVGDDWVGEQAIDTFESWGVDVVVTRLEDEETTRKYVFVDDTAQVALFSTAGANEGLEPGRREANTLVGAHGLHLTGQDPETAARLATMADERDVPVSFDPGRKVFEREYTATLERADLVFATDREADAIDTHVPWRVTKHGTGGATLSYPGGELTHAGFEVDAVDSTGAGDAFAAGFLAVHRDGGDSERALEVGNACGAIATRTLGSNARLSWSEIRELTGA